MSDEACPHVSLALHANHQAKELGSMIKMLKSLTDWQFSQVPGLFFSPSAEAWRIDKVTHDTVHLEHDQLDRDHGREKTDHPDSASMYAILPAPLWSKGPCDVGSCLVPPVSF